MKTELGDARYFYKSFGSHPNTSSSAGWIFESRMHGLLGEGNPIPLFRIKGHRAKVNFIYDDYTASKKKNPTSFWLPKSEEHALERAVEEEIPLSANQYYHPVAPNFRTIDSLLSVHPTGDPSPTLLLFQITRNKQTPTPPRHASSPPTTYGRA